MSYIPLREDLAVRVVRDINHILRQGWADEISRRDFYHGHVCQYINPGNPQRHDGGALLQNSLNPASIILLYHSHELDEKKHDPNRNIASYQGGQSPMVVPVHTSGEWFRKKGDFFGDLRQKEQGVVAVYARDLGLDEWFDFVFDYDPNGKYELENCRRININAELFQHEMDRLFADLANSLSKNIKKNYPAPSQD
ncbi:hypothetical protein HYV89_05565 [Candidatus Woesearchaeota archaeon]|nr:hypothetical protein [Candidatus Woesearchaeota archaeon]